MRATGRAASAGLAVCLLLTGVARASVSPAPVARPDSSDCAVAGLGLVRFPSPSPGDTLRLPHRLVSRASLGAWGDSARYTEGVHFRLDPVAGRIVWLLAPSDSGDVTVRYRYLPLSLRGLWGARTAAPAETLAVPAIAMPEARGLPPGASLAIGGSKTFGLEFGNRRDAQLTQSLDVTVNGQLAPGVKVRAVLTDRTMPLQPEGTTAELEDLDQVLIELSAPWGDMRLGDVEVEQRDFQFAAHRRAMEGARLRLEPARPARGGGAVGRGVGRHASLEFFGVEGKQGPYRLLQRRPGEDAVVVAGSERVWLDGVRLRRGEDADYTVDYAGGAIWFTPRRVIRSVSEIRVDCQVREGVFERTYYALNGAAGDSARGVALAWLRESDDPDRAVAAALTAAERESLRDAGDAPGALAAGARPDSAGDYALVRSDSLAAPFYLYVAEEPDPAAYGARYAVVFTEVGPGRGDYDNELSLKEVWIYRYVGYRRGRFAPGRRLTAPEARDVLAARAQSALGGGVSVAGEVAISRHDRNLLSPQDDGDNLGGALAASAGWQVARLWGGRADAVELRVRARDVQQRFSPAEPLDPSFYYRRWNASRDSVLDGRDRRGALGLACRPRRDLRCAWDWEAIRAGHRFEGRRWNVRAERLGRIRVLGEIGRSRTREGATPGKAERERVTLGWAGATAAEVAFDAEALHRGAADADTVERFESIGLRVSSSRWLPGLDAALDGQLRRDWRRRAGPEERVADRRLYQTDLRYAGGGVAARVLYARRVTEQARGGLRETADLADWSLARQDPDARLTGEWRGRLTAEENRLRLERLQRVTPGGGHYDSLGRYVGRGDYELYFQPGDSSALETRLETALRGQARPFASSSSGLAGLEATAFGRVEVRTPESPARLLGAWKRWFAGPAPVRGHDRVLRGELAWSGAARAPAPRLRWEQRRGRERSPSGFERGQTGDERALDVRWTPREALRTRVEWSRERTREGVIAASGGEASDERRSWKLGLETGWAPVRRVSLRSGAERGDERYDPGAVRRWRTRASLGVAVEPYRASRAEIAYERTWLGEAAVSTLPSWVEKPGWSLNGNASVQPRSGLNLTLSVRVDRRRGENAIVSGRMDARAYF